MTLFLWILVSIFPANAMQPPVGIGMMAGDQKDEPSYALTIEGNNHFKQRKGPFGVAQYGMGQSRLELGPQSGITMAAVSGITAYGIQDEEWFSPHLGFEPMSGRITWNTSDTRESFYEWLPSASIGPQFGFASCRALPLARAGGAVGNLGKSGFLPRLAFNYGAGLHINCRKIDIAADFTRVQRGSTGTDLLTLDVAFHFPRLRSDDLGFGVRAEAIGAEKRMLVLIRGNPFG